MAKTRDKILYSKSSQRRNHFFKRQAVVGSHLREEGRGGFYPTPQKTILRLFD